MDKDKIEQLIQAKRDRHAAEKNEKQAAEALKAARRADAFLPINQVIAVLVERGTRFTTYSQTQTEPMPKPNNPDDFHCTADRYRFSPGYSRIWSAQVADDDRTFTVYSGDRDERDRSARKPMQTAEEVINHLLDVVAKHEIPPPPPPPPTRESERRLIRVVPPHVEVEPFTCVCGNTAESDGAYPCDSTGKEVEPTPEEWPGNLYYCARCRVIFEGETGKIVAPQPNRPEGSTKQP